MSNFSVLYQNQPIGLSLPATDLSVLPAKLSKKLWVSPAEFIRLTHAVAVAEWALHLSNGWRPRLPAPPRRGPQIVYRDSTIMVMAVIQVAWQLGYEEVSDYFRNHTPAAQAAELPPGRRISASQYWERRQALGVLPFWFFLVVMVGQLMRLGVIYGTDVILDGTTLQAWFHHDPQAGWSFPKPWKGSTWGYKVHTVLCRWSQLPMMFLVTSANRQELVLAIPLLSLMVLCFGFTIQLVRADAGYFTTPIMTFIRCVLEASFVIDYNLRRKGKRFLATLFFIDQWRFHLRPRAIIERHFAWAKRYFGLESARWQGRRLPTHRFGLLGDVRRRFSGSPLSAA
ncbi:MAG: hypothetical protein BroJett011_78010 [Chloroflexota bacterium]|nr:MAG: hypothetical protein BroJett011_78010 [Chloroflexota bacterium]